jgi:hypothetical protein
MRCNATWERSGREYYGERIAKETPLKRFRVDFHAVTLALQLGRL